MPRIIAALALALPLMASSLAAQQTEPLAVGRTVTRTLAVGQSHSYTVALDSGQFVSGQAVQDGIDLQVIVVQPAGDTLARFDSPNGTEGPEPFQFTTSAEGDFRIVIAPFETATGSGEYTLTLASVEPLADTPAGRIEQVMRRVRADDPGVAAAVLRNGEVIYQQAWGLANLSHRIPFTVETRTNIGSTSKHFTAFAILLLEQQGKLAIEDDVRKHIPELPDLGDTVRIRHLLTHTSGYREFLNALSMTGRRIDMGDYVDRDEIIALVQRQPALQNRPGAEFNYNNTAFALLATIVERVGGKPFPEWMQEHVFQPVGMRHTLVRSTVGQVIPNSSQGYVPIAGGWREAQDIGASMGAGGIYTTLGDLARWVQNFKTGAVGAPDFFTRMTTRNVLTSGDTSPYGFGLFIDRWRGLARVHHGGADIAHRSALVYFPELDAAVTVQSNNASFNVDAAAAEMAELFFEAEIEKAAANAPAVLAATGEAAFDTARFDALAGRYALTEAPAFILSFSRRGDRYYTQATGQPEIEMTPTSDSTFVIRQVNAVITFHREADGSVKRITLNQNGMHPALRVGEDGAPTAGAAAAQPDLGQYAGRYFSAELETFFDIVVEGDSLMLRGRRTTPVRLRHQREDTFSGTGLPVATLTFERDGSGKVVAFKAGNGRTRDVVFKREE